VIARLVIRAGQWLLVTLALSAALLLAAEGLMRALGIHFPALRYGDRAQDLWVYDRSKGWFHRPGFETELSLGGPDRGRVRTNSLGLRGPEVAPRKPAGTRRVIVVGDSYVFGQGVDDDQTMPARLSRRLNDRGPGRYEVVNLGVNSYSTDQELILLEELGPRLEPDIVVLFVCDNDFEANMQDFVNQRYYTPYFVLGADGRLTRRNVPVPGFTAWQRTKLWLGQRSEVWNGVRSRRSDIPWVAGALGALQVATPMKPQSDELALTAALVVAMRDLSARLGAEFVVMNTGQRGEIVSRHQRLRPLLRREGIRLLGIEGNLGEARARQPSRPWDFPNDTHWNVASHELVAHITFNFLEASALLDEAAPAKGAARAPAGGPRR
jgi:hypothetical protein